MKTAVWHGPRDIRIEDRPEPGEPGRGEVIIAVERAGICGSDVSEFLDGPHAIPMDRPHPLTGRKAPLILGHEYSGVVVAVGDGVDGIKEGDRVCGDATLRCNECFWCKKGEYNLCKYGAAIGLHTDGAFAEFLTVPAYTIVHLPDEITFEEGAMVEPLAVGLHAIKKGSLVPGEEVVIFGFGMIGAAIALFAKASGAAGIYIVEPNESRRRAAEELGVDGCYDAISERSRREIYERTGKIGPDVVFDCTGRTEAFHEIVEYARRGGRVVIAGIGHSKAELDTRRVVYYERMIIGAIGYQYDLPLVVKMMAKSMIDVKKFIGDVIPLTRIVTDGFERLVASPATPLRVLVDPKR